MSTSNSKVLSLNKKNYTYALHTDVCNAYVTLENSQKTGVTSFYK